MQKTDERNTITFIGILIWLLATLFFLYEFFLRAVLGTLAPEFMPDLGLNAEMFGLLGSAYYITYALMQVPVGILTDKFGLKRILVFATVTCALATYWFANVHSFSGAFLSRALMGFGSSFAFVCVLVIVANWFPKKNFGLFVGMSQFIGTMGPLLAGGPLAALLVMYQGQWRIVIWQIAIVGLVLGLLIFLFVKDKPRGEVKTMIFLKHSESLTQRLKPLMRNSQVWAVACYSGCLYIGMPLVGELWGASFLQASGFSIEESASTVSVSWLGYSIGCLLLGAFSDAIKRRKTVLVFCALLGLVVSSSFTYVHFNPHWVYIVLFFLLGVASSGQSVAFAAIAEHADLSTKATALGLNNAFITFFAVIIPPVSGYLIGMMSEGHVITYHDFTKGFSIMPVMFVLALFNATFWIRETYCKPQREPIILQVG